MDYVRISKKKPKTESCGGLWAESFNLKKKEIWLRNGNLPSLNILVLLVLSRFLNYKFFAELDEDTICFFIDNRKFRIARRHLCEG
jgi:hypothetical protein